MCNIFVKRRPRENKKGGGKDGFHIVTQATFSIRHTTLRDRSYNSKGAEKRVA